MSVADADIEFLERALRDKDDIIQAQYTEITSLRERLRLAVGMLKEAVPSRMEPPAATSSNLGHG